ISGRGPGAVKILAIDPGPEQSAFVIWDGVRVLDHAIVPNADLFRRLGNGVGIHTCAIEMIASYGMAVGRETFETCVWIGRFIEKWRDYAGAADALRIPRGD